MDQMESLRQEFKEGEIPEELLAYHCKDNEGLNGEWIITEDQR
ncbi:hypothetical protein, conserved [Eimeria tenella]|uniref:Uncharacterized protein n=1 Tax=Eimeria tenella TaxID=5802 RepID=U6L7X5_EIMTE|nr:hypothetical protein, conserved [Eimeria tenella]CDJ44674.1 hypothetical protein, conserved [Eimeria tenella]|eukprot:XP_013235422.1 hypothetical protein, conserved [Eimeria tenella]